MGGKGPESALSKDSDFGTPIFSGLQQYFGESSGGRGHLKFMNDSQIQLDPCVAGCSVWHGFSTPTIAQVAGSSGVGLGKSQ